MGKGKGNLVAETVTKFGKLGAVLSFGSRGARKDDRTGKDSAWLGGSLVAGRRGATVVVGSRRGVRKTCTCGTPQLSGPLRWPDSQTKRWGSLGVLFFQTRIDHRDGMWDRKRTVRPAKLWRQPEGTL